MFLSPKIIFPEKGASPRRKNPVFPEGEGGASPSPPPQISCFFLKKQGPSAPKIFLNLERHQRHTKKTIPLNNDFQWENEPPEAKMLTLKPQNHDFQGENGPPKAKNAHNLRHNPKTPKSQIWDSLNEGGSLLKLPLIVARSALYVGKSKADVPLIPSVG